MKKIAFSENEHWALIIHFRLGLGEGLANYLEEQYGIIVGNGEGCVLVDRSPLLEKEDIEAIKKAATEWLEREYNETKN